MTTSPQQTESSGSVFLFDNVTTTPEPLHESQSLPYEMAITGWHESEPVYEEGIGHRTKTIVEFDDGSRFVYQKFVPEHQVSAISVDFTPPLGTRIKGFNTYLQRKMAKAGLHSRLIGTNQAKGFSLLHDAQAMLSILEHEDQQSAENPTCAPNKSALIGYSMGEMKALAVEGLASNFNREIVFMKGLDPCIARKVEYHPSKLPKLIPYLVNEVMEVPRIFVRDARRNSIAHAAMLGKNLLQTMGYTAKYSRSTLDKWNTIATGEAGTFAENIPDEAIMIIHFFEKSDLNDQDIFAQQLRNKLNVRLLYEDGYHLTGADPAVLQNLIEQIVFGLQLVEHGAAPHEIADALNVPILPPHKKLLAIALAGLCHHKAA